MVTVATVDAPLLSVTLRLATRVPAVVYVYVGVGEVESLNAPSPSRSQSKVIGSPSGSLEPVPSNWTVRGGGPLVGVADATAIGAEFPARNCTRLMVPPLKST